eukprot:3572691-Rhodomonas_salina.1
MGEGGGTRERGEGKWLALAVLTRAGSAHSCWQCSLLLAVLTAGRDSYEGEGAEGAEPVAAKVASPRLLRAREAPARSLCFYTLAMLLHARYMPTCSRWACAHVPN